MNIIELLKNNPEITPSIVVAVPLPDLREFAKLCIEAGRQERPEPAKTDKIVTAEEFTRDFDISETTLWSWDRKGITKPIYIGKRKYYKQSDIDQILNR